VIVIAVKLIRKGDDRPNQEEMTRDNQSILLEDIQSERIGESPNSLDPSKYASLRMKQNRLPLKSSVHRAKRCGKEPALELLSTVTSAVQKTSAKYDQARPHQKDQR
jgi:hypothetical protein